MINPMVNSNELYIVVDIEADGPVPGLYSMLSIGAVATTADQEVSSFYRTIKPLPDAIQDPGTMEWWRGQPDAWAEVTTNPQDPMAVMTDFVAWVKSIGKNATFVANPIALDYTFVSWYLFKFTGENPFRNDNNLNRALDLRSYLAGRLNLPIDQAHLASLPDKYTTGMPDHSHNALDDARGYGVMFRNILNEESESTLSYQSRS